MSLLFIFLSPDLDEFVERCCDMPKKKEENVEELKIRRPPRVGLVLGSATLISTIAAALASLGICYGLYLLFDQFWGGAPIYVWIAITPFLYFAVKWAFKLTLLCYAHFNIKPLEEGYHDFDMRDETVRKWVVNAALTSFTGVIVGTFPWGQPGIGARVFRAMGAKMGKNSIAAIMGEPYMVEMGDNSTCGVSSILATHVIEGNKFYMAKIRIGNNVVVGGQSMIFPGVTIGDNSIIAAMSLVPKDTKIPPNTVWAGVPARQVGIVDKDGKIVKMQTEELKRLGR
jgi:acetyltransferase-like isoleucine patch superfamily enzyme